MHLAKRPRRQTLTLAAPNLLNQLPKISGVYSCSGISIRYAVPVCDLDAVDFFVAQGPNVGFAKLVRIKNFQGRDLGKHFGLSRITNKIW